MIETPERRLLVLGGVVVSVDFGIGFSVQFTEISDDDRAALAHWTNAATTGAAQQS